MISRAIMFLGLRMARRNHFHLFAWLCALAVPGALQLTSYLSETLRTEVLREYFGVISLYMYFALTFGFAAVFASYYIAAYYRRRESLDALTLAGARPGQMLLGAFGAIEWVLVPPTLAFSVGMVAYGLWAPTELTGFALQGWELPGLMYVLLMNQAIIAATVITGLLGREDVAALLAMFMMLLLNILPVIVLFILNWPVLAYAGILLGLLALLLVVALWLLKRRWPPHALGIGERLRRNYANGV